MDDHFLLQIQEAESRSTMMVEEAFEKKQREVESLRRDLVEKRSQNIKKHQENLSAEIISARVIARQMYESELKKNEGMVKTMETEKSVLIDEISSQAETFFLQKIR